MSAPDNRQSRVFGILKLAQGVASRFSNSYGSSSKAPGPEKVSEDAKLLREKFAGAFMSDAGAIVHRSEKAKDDPAVQRLIDDIRRKDTVFGFVAWSLVALAAMVIMGTHVATWIAWNLLRNQEIPPAGVNMMLGIIVCFAVINAVTSSVRAHFARRVRYGLPELEEVSLRETAGVMASDEWRRLSAIGAIIGNRTPLDIAEIGSSLDYSVERALTDRALAVLEAERDGKEGEAKSLRNVHFREAYELARREKLTNKAKWEEFFDDAAEDLRRGVQSAHRKAVAAVAGKVAPPDDHELWLG